MMRMRYTMPARSQGNDFMQRTVGVVRVRTTPKKTTLELCDRLSNPLIEVDATLHKTCPDVVCDLGYGIAPGTVIDEGCATGIACTPAAHVQDMRKER